MKLLNPTDQELDAAFAEHVAGWRPSEEQIEKAVILGEALYGEITLPQAVVNAAAAYRPKFTRSFDAVLPWLERHGWDWEHRFTGPISSGPVIETIAAYGPDSKAQYGKHDYAQGTSACAKAAVIALLRAHGHEVEFTT